MKTFQEFKIKTLDKMKKKLDDLPKYNQKCIYSYSPSKEVLKLAIEVSYMEKYLK